MIVYDRLWETMKKKGISQYSLIKDYHVNEAQLHRLRKNKVIKTITLDRLCEILDCEVEDICQHIKGNPDEAQGHFFLMPLLAPSENNIPGKSSIPQNKLF